MATATKKADWKTLKKFMASVGEPTRDQWDELSEQAEQFDDYTSSLAVEYLALFEPSEDETTDNAFCPTGKGGGVDPTCSPGKGKAGTTPCPEPCYNPLPSKTHSRVGVPADEVPPPPKIGRIPNLNAKERAVESNFIKAYESDPDKMASGFRSLITDSTPEGQPKVFGTDDAKVLTDAWGGEDMGIRSVNRATMNVALHQTANAIAKRAFVQELDSLKPGDEIMVTVGGCGAGKGYALKNVPQALEAKGKSKVVWDSAGDQNATENAWIQKEAETRGLKATYVFVHADPKVQWADPNRGVVKRAGDPNDGRMVDAKVFADSYAHGAKNHNNFYKANKDNPNAKFLFLENGAQPKLLPGIPKEALKYKSDDLERFAVDAVKKSGAPKHVQEGALIGQRLWN